ncbi:MAG: DUF4261 domain-containing protein [Hyphomicrobiaceae bacterium]|nr:DUF4261 domain-containing protein [Hyphomicrobiaceae bacterium]MCC0007269.1 DUF4261 domain-containing protein [Hyphomicrobiaceae bacterium]
MADEEGQRPRQILSMIFLERAQMPDLERLKERFGDLLNIGEILPAEGAAQVVPCDGALLITGLIDAPLPKHHWQGWAESAWWWPEAAQTMQNNQAHVIVSSSWDQSSRLDAHVKQTLVVRELVDQLPAMAVSWGNVLVSANQFAGEFHKFQQEQVLPVRLWVLIQLSGDGQGGTIVSTLGMDAFGLKEIEANSAPMEPQDALIFVNNLADYLITNGPVVNDGDTVGGSDTARIKVRVTPSFRDGVGDVYLLDFEREDGPEPVKPGSKFAQGVYGKGFRKLN